MIRSFKAHRDRAIILQIVYRQCLRGRECLLGSPQALRNQSLRALMKQLLDVELSPPPASGLAPFDYRDPKITSDSFALKQLDPDGAFSSSGLQQFWGNNSLSS